jgi:ABC transport system ATP-binding/permease protein
MWKLAIEDDQGNKTVVNLVRDEYSIGRSEENTVRLTERNISRRHASLRHNGSGWLLQDQQSYNGCFVNGVRVAEPHKLDHGDLVQLGDYRLEVVDETATASVPIPGGPDVISKSQTLLGQPDRLVMTSQPTPGVEYAMTGARIVIGRGEECDISINHASVSRVHAEIHPLGDGRYEIIDRESANGIRVNGVELQRSLIDFRDTIELGDVVMKYIAAGQIYRPTADESQQIAAYPVLPSERNTPAPVVESRVAAPGLPPTVKIFAALFMMALLVVLGMVVFGGKKPPSAEGEIAAVVDPATRTLEEARGLLERGEVEAAHLKVTGEIAEDSNVRESEEFRDIEARWADMLFEQAGAENDPAQRRTILERISGTTTVDSARRTRAANEIAALDEGVDVDSLPSASVVKLDPEATRKPQGSDIVRKNPFEDAPRPKPAAPKEPGEAPKPAAGGANTNDVFDGERQKNIALKNALKAKVQSGKGTEQDARLLRALCRQLGDMSCAH